MIHLFFIGNSVSTLTSKKRTKTERSEPTSHRAIVSPILLRSREFYSVNANILDPNKRKIYLCSFWFWFHFIYSTLHISTSFSCIIFLTYLLYCLSFIINTFNLEWKERTSLERMAKVFLNSLFCRVLYSMRKTTVEAFSRDRTHAISPRETRLLLICQVEIHVQ